MTGIRKIQCLALGGMLAFSTVSLAETKNESSQTSQPTTGTEAPRVSKLQTNVIQMPETEVVTKSTAEVLRANVEQVNNTAVSTAHNPKLDAMLKKMIETKEDREYLTDFISTIYSENGLFAGSAYVQHEIDRRNFINFLKANTKILKDNNIAPDMADKIDKHKEDFEKSVYPYLKEVFQWMSTDYSPDFYDKIPENDKPSYEDVKKAIDDMVHNDKGLTKGDRVEYNFATERFTQKLKNPNSNQAKSLDIAYRTYYYDMLKFVKKAKQIGINGEGYFRANLPLRTWLDKTAPKNE